MTEQELSEIEARVNTATPGPWVPSGYAGADISTPDGEYPKVIESDGGLYWGFDQERRDSIPGAGHEYVAGPDHIFVMHAREDIPRLLAEVRRLREWKKRNNSMFITVSKRPYHCCANDCLDYVNNNLAYVELSKPVPHATDCPDFTVDGELK